MASSFLGNIEVVIDAKNGNAENGTAETCESNINHYKFYQFALIPAVLIALLFAVTKPRRSMFLSVWGGRPGLIFPMDTLTRSSRISYACGFGATAFLVYEIVLEQKYAINYTDGHRAVKSFVAIASMFIYGFVFFPLFASLSIGSVFGHAMGALYVWMLTAVEIYKIFECPVHSVEARVLLLLRGLPSLGCLVYLSVIIPIRMVKAFRRGYYFVWRDDCQETNALSDIRDSYAGHHVRKLFRKPQFKLPPETKKGRIIAMLLSLAHRLLYQREKGFRYPARMISVLFTAVLVIYTLTFETLAIFPQWTDLYRDGIHWQLDTVIGREPTPNEAQETTDLRAFLSLALWLLNVLKISIIVSTVTAAVCALLNVMHTLSSYRANLFALYRGDHSHIPPASAASNINHCINSIKYAGFQVGYIIWSFVIQLIIFVIIALLLALVITMIIYDFTAMLEFLFQLLWPVVVTVVLVMVVQYVMARFVFLQERGLYLALDNRSVYFNFAYFMFFYNIFLGLVSCILRILKAMVLGIVFLSRLDNSTLSRRFEFLDPGFKAYVGYMHVEAAHTHPVLVIFSRLMMLALSDKREREEGKKTKSTLDAHDPPGSASTGPIELVVRNNRVHSNPYVNGYDDNGGYGNDPKGTLDPTITDPSEEERRRRVAARSNWHVTYTLLHNPDIRVMRKGYMHMLRQARQMGIHIAASDRQADVNFEQLQEQLADAKEKLNPSSKKKKEKAEDLEVDDEDLKEVVWAAENGDVKKAMSVSSSSLPAAQVNCLAAAAPLEGSSLLAPAVPPKEQSVDEQNLPSASVDSPGGKLVEGQSVVGSEQGGSLNTDMEDLPPVSYLPPEHGSRDVLHGGQPGQDSTQQEGTHHRAASPRTSKDNVAYIRF